MCLCVRAYRGTLIHPVYGRCRVSSRGARREPVRVGVSPRVLCAFVPLEAVLLESRTRTSRVCNCVVARTDYIRCPQVSGAGIGIDVPWRVQCAMQKEGEGMKTGGNKI